MKQLHRCWLTLLLSTLSFLALAQRDTVIVKQGDLLIGEFKSMTQGVLFLKTPYSPTNISINWNDVIFLRAAKQYLVQGSKGKTFSGKLGIDSFENKKLIVKTGDSTFTLEKTNIDQIIEFTGAKAQDRLTLHVDLGYTLTKVDDAQQFSFATDVNYKIKKWEFTLNSSIYATAVRTITGGRGDLSFGAQYVLPKNWFFIAQSSLFYSTEQDISRRFSPLVGMGTYLLRKSTNKLNIYGGIMYNLEKFTTSDTVFKSSEAFLATMYKFHIFRKIDISTTIVASPSFTDSGRWRAYYHADLGYEISEHFNFGFEYTLNTDNKPPVNSNKSDYVYNFRIGWQL